MEEIQAFVESSIGLLFLVSFWFTNKVINKTAEKRQALALKHIQKACNARYKSRQHLLSAIGDIDREMDRAERTKKLNQSACSAHKSHPKVPEH